MWLLLKHVDYSRHKRTVDILQECFLVIFKFRYFGCGLLRSFHYNNNSVNVEGSSFTVVFDFYIVFQTFIVHRNYNLP